MAKPVIHAKSSARKFGGKAEEYMPIHDFLDSSKSALPDNRHRALTHTSWFLSTVLERVFGTHFVNSDGRTVSVRDIGEQHILEDFDGEFIPTASDYLSEMEIKSWMNNAQSGRPESARKLPRRTVKSTRRIEWNTD